MEENRRVKNSISCEDVTQVYHLLHVGWDVIKHDDVGEKTSMIYIEHDSGVSLN